MYKKYKETILMYNCELQKSVHGPIGYVESQERQREEVPRKPVAEKIGF